MRKKFVNRLDERSVHSVMQLPETRLGNDHAGHIETAAIKETSRIRTVAVQRKQWGNELLPERGNVFLITFETTHALLLPGGRILRPQGGRGQSTEHLRDVNHARPQARQIREHEQAQDKSQSRSLHVREQSASAFSPRQQSGRIRDQGTVSTDCCQTSAADATSPQKSQDFAPSTSEASTRTDFGRDSEQATNRPRFCIVVATIPATSFPVPIRIISSHVHL